MRLSIKKQKGNVIVTRSPEPVNHHKRSKLLMAFTALFLGFVALAVYSPTVGATGHFLAALGNMNAMQLIVGMSVAVVVGIGTVSLKQ